MCHFLPIAYIFKCFYNVNLQQQFKRAKYIPTMNKDLKTGEDLVEKGHFLEAKAIFTELLNKSFDETSTRILENRLDSLNKVIKNATHKLYIDSELTSDSLNCCVKIVFKHEHIKAMIKRLFFLMHKKNYDKDSSITLDFGGNAANLNISGKDIDDICCAFCKKFRNKLIDNIDKNDIVIYNNCFMEKNA